MLATPFHPRTEPLNEGRQWRDWSGYQVASLYEPTHEREYFAVRNSAALFDVSPLFKYDFRGPDVVPALNRLMTRDMSRCRVGQVMYSCWCDEHGMLIQDGNAVRLAEDHYRVSAALPSLRWFEDVTWGYDVEITDCSREIAALALQGPRSRAILEAVFSRSLGKLRYFRSAVLPLGAATVTVTRTGFTGDLGYELWVDREHALPLWDRLMAAGKDHAILPAGLVALDAARIEAGLVLIEVDFLSAPHALLERRKSSPFDAGLDWTVQFTDDHPFVGRAALEQQKEAGPRFTIVGLEIEFEELERLFNPAGLRPQTVGRPPNRTPVPVFLGDEFSKDGEQAGLQVGQATSQVFSPWLRKHLALATLERRYAETGRFLAMEMTVEFERKRAKAKIVELPFFDPERKRSYEKSPR